MNLVFLFVEAQNKWKQFEIKHSSNRCEQKSITDGFASFGDVGFKSCVDAIDGILIWIQRPSEDQASIAGVDRKNHLW